VKSSGTVDGLSYYESLRFSIVIPVHNEGSTIEGVLRDYATLVASKLGSSILVCEDGSTDNTRAVLNRLSKEIPLRLVTHEDRLGYAGGVKSGLRRADGDVLFFSDSDGQYDPREFWDLQARLADGDLIIGTKTKREEAFHRILLSQGFHLLVKLLFGVRLHDIDCGFRLIRKHVVNTVLDQTYDLPYSFWAEFTIISSFFGFRIVEVPVSHRSRLQGNTTIYKPLSLPMIIIRQAIGLLRLRRRIGMYRKAIFERTSIS
jgi:glycosyltransferase involved in cell wall biosynthesis